MSPKEGGLGVVALGLVAPVLAFPSAFGLSAVGPIAAVAMVAMVAAVILLRHSGSLAWCVAAFALMVYVGWKQTPAPATGLNHFAGIALGLFAMATTTAWCRTRQRLLIAVVVFLALGVAALSVGYRSAPSVHKRKVLMSDTTAVPPPVTPLPLPALHARQTVNTNALAATAMMVLPVAAAVATVTARWIQLPGALRTAGLLTALGAAAVTVLMQSRSAWLAALVVFWLWLRTRIGPFWWRVVSVVMLLVVPGIVFVAWSDHPRVADVVATLGARLNIWDDAFDALRSSPWIGIGLDYFRDSGYSMVLAPPDQMVGTPHAHNIVLQTALDVGVIGLMAYVAFLGVLLWRALRLARTAGADMWVKSVGVGAALSVVAVHAYGALDAVSLGAKVGLFQWLASGLVLAACQLTGQGRDKQETR